MKKILLSSLLLAFLALAGCASVPMATPEADQKAKAFASSSSSVANVYIFRDSLIGTIFKKMVRIDGQDIGETAVLTYYSVAAKPGKRVISTESEFGDNSIELNLEAGKNYYVRQYLMMVAGVKLEVVEEEEAKKAITESCKLAQPVTNKTVY